MLSAEVLHIRRGRPLRRLSAAAVLAAMILPAVPRAGAGEIYLWPLHGQRRLSSSFSEYRDGHYHAGIDLRSYGALGLPCLAVSSGYVARVKVGPAGYGKALYLKLEDGNTAVYAHLDQFSREIDSLAWHYRVSRETDWCDFRLPANAYPFAVGDTVAFSGETGTSAPHLHFELRDESERPKNPLEIIYSVPDRSPPMISGLEVFPLAEGSVSGDGPLPAIKYLRASGSKRYLLPDTLHLDGEFGFGVSTWDEQGFGSYRMAPASIEIAVDGQTLYTVNNKVFSYSQSGEISAEYDIVGDGPAGRYLRLFPVPGVTRSDRSGPGIVHTGESGEGLALQKGLHVGLITVRDASGNVSSAVFHFAMHSLPEISLARRLDAADEVVVSASDPDGGEVHVRVAESPDGGGSWEELPVRMEGEYFSAAVSAGENHVYRVTVRDDEGGTVRRWFAAPGGTGERDMAFVYLDPGTWERGVVLRASTDAILASRPEISAAGSGAPGIYQLSPREYVAVDWPRAFGPGLSVFTFSGLDYRGFPVDGAEASRIFTVNSGGRAEFVLSDSIAARIEAPSLRTATVVRLAELPMRGEVPSGLTTLSMPFELDFRVEDLSRDMRLYCEPDSNAGLFMWDDDKGWKPVGVPAMEGGFVTVGKPGIYVYLRDGIPPLVEHVAVEKGIKGSGFFKPYFCSVPVTEDGTGVDPWSATAVLGGRRMVCEWDEFRKRLVIPVPADFPPGHTVLEVEVSDRAGNRSVGEFGFVLE